MEQALRYHQQYFDNLQKVLQGTLPKLDTTALALPKLENSDD